MFLTCPVETIGKGESVAVDELGCKSLLVKYKSVFSMVCAENCEMTLLAQQ